MYIGYGSYGVPARPTLCLFIGKEKRDERKEFQFDLI